MDFIPNYDLAKRQVGDTRFGTYSSAYIITNENLRASMKFVPRNCDNALVVAASGDHPLFCSLYGAKNVDTFDISYNAKCMMDIKVAAINTLGYLDYIRLLDDLFSLPICITDVKNMNEVLCKLPKIEYDYIYELRNWSIFSRGLRPKFNMFLPTIIEYNKLRKNINKPYNFELTDVCNLSASLTKSYDFIHLSNIFDYVTENDYEELLFSIIKFINPGGRIVMESFEDDSHFYLGTIGPKISAFSGNKFVLKKLGRMHIFERIK